MDQPTDNGIVAALERGDVLWPGLGHIRDVAVAEDTYVELLGGRRRFMIVEEPDSARVGDLLAVVPFGRQPRDFYPVGLVRLFVVTLLTEPSHLGYRIASVRPVRLTLGE